MPRAAGAAEEEEERSAEEDVRKSSNRRSEVWRPAPPRANRADRRRPPLSRAAAQIAPWADRRPQRRRANADKPVVPRVVTQASRAQPSPAAQDSPSSGSRSSPARCAIAAWPSVSSTITSTRAASAARSPSRRHRPRRRPPHRQPPRRRPSPRRRPPAPATAAAPPRGGAFAVMMGTARQAAKVLPCSLVRDGDGRLAVVWTALGADDVGWSAECQLKNGTAHPTRAAGRVARGRRRRRGGRPVCRPARPRAERVSAQVGAAEERASLPRRRRRQVRVGVAAARSDGVSQLLRRLPVIAVEDALPPPRSFAILVWLMAAHAKGFTLGRAHVDEVIASRAPSRRRAHATTLRKTTAAATATGLGSATTG